MRQTGSTDLENCPVSDDLLKHLLEATINSVAEVASNLPEAQRAELAIYCYRRAHFRQLGLSLARLCSKQSLVLEAGHAGGMIYLQASNSDAHRETDIRGRARSEKAPVSLHVV